jgi:3-mercaptopropionate dioxygenase
MSTSAISSNTAIQSTRFQNFLQKVSEVIDTSFREPETLQRISLLLKALVSNDNWLPPEYAVADPAHYRQYLLYADPADRFSVVSFVWGPNQKNPIHNHTTWGVSGVLRGGENQQLYKRLADGALVEDGHAILLLRGRVEAVSPDIGDLHQVSNAFEDRVSVSIHVYGGNIGKIERSIFEIDGTQKRFVSNYSRPEESRSIVELRA